jgi:serine/threonine protein kinase
LSSGPIAFEVSHKLADGSVGEVYLARAPKLGRSVVLKVLRAELTTDEELVGRFLDECQLLASLSHPGILPYLATGQVDDGRYYLLTEHFEGGTLADRLKRQGPLSPKEVGALVGPLAEALDYVHEKGVVHRDLKPDNVLLVGSGDGLKPVLIDFGLAHFQGKKTVRTSAGQLLATPEYAAPECVQGKKADARSDLYALGIMLYEALTGAPPFVGTDLSKLLLRHLHAPVPPLTGPAAVLFPVMQRLLAKVPDERYQNAKDAAHAIQEALHPVSVAPTLVPGALEPSAPQDVRPPVPPASLAPSPPVDTGPAPENPLGTLGNYELVKLLGEGAMGQVFQARHARLGRQVALKLLKPHHAQDKGLLARFFQEAKTVNQVNHEHIVEIHDFVEDVRPDGSPQAYCVMELLVGQTLHQLNEKQALPLALIIKIMRQVCQGLAAAHRVGVVHRDVKPDNIFIAERSGATEYVKLLDFGVAKQTGAKLDGGTRTGVIMGTPEYMAPEQAAGREVDRHVDIWAVGVVLYELLCGRRPYDAEAFGQLVVDLNTKPIPPLPVNARSGEEIPPRLRALVTRCLSRRPQERPDTMEVVDRELERALDKPRPLPVTDPARAPPSSEPQPGPLPSPEELAAVQSQHADSGSSSVGWWLVLALALSLLGGGVVYGKTHPEQLPPQVRELLTMVGISSP